MDDRKSYILKKIIETFIESAEPVGSKSLLQAMNLNVSSATIRNDMAYLESIGLIAHKHTSSGRVPTVKGFRVFVDELMDDIPSQVLEKKMALEDLQKVQVRELDIRVRNSVDIISKTTKNISFATLPWRDESYYLGISHILKNIEFQDNVFASTIVEILEDKDRFVQLLSGLPITHDVQAFIGEENAIPGIKSCTMLVTMYECGTYRGAVGILGSTRMKYAYNMEVLRKVRDDMECGRK